MGLRNVIQSGRFLVLAEIDPPKGTDLSGFYETAGALKNRVDACVVSDLPGAVMTMSSLAACSLLGARGMETVYTILCRDRNILALQSDILGAAALGIGNICVRAGEEITTGDHPRAKPVGEINDAELLAVVDAMEKGTDAAGNGLNGAPSFFKGSAVEVGVGDSDVAPLAENMLARKDRGADFFITSPVFDLKRFERFMTVVRQMTDAPVIAETVILKSVGTARYINRHLPGVEVPDRYMDALYSAGSREKASMEITAELIRGFMGLCEGVSIRALGWERKVPAYLSEAGI